MIAMDVVDTIRHREDLVRRELNEEGREAELIERLREIYRQQGIEVSDSVLEDGVKALKDSRFTWTPPPPSWRRTLFEWWTRRMRIGAFAGVALAALLTTCGIQYLTVTRPAINADNRAKVELNQTLPQDVRQAYSDIIAVASDDKAKRDAEAIKADADRAQRNRDRAALIKARDRMRDLRRDVFSQYTLKIVSRPGAQTGVWRRPPGGSSARNYYIIVEAIAPDGSLVKIPVRSEENGQTSVTSMFGVRVPKETWDKIAADKRDDGIVQNNTFATKKRGRLLPDYLMPFNGGMITKW